MFKALLKISIVILTLLAITLLALFTPKYAGEVSYRGEVSSIRRDANNIPTITSPSRKGYFYAMGRVHAEDRLFQMSFKLLVIQGRLAEHLGERPLPIDKFMREVNLYDWGLKMAERLYREDRNAFEEFQGYVDGVNDFVASLTVLPFDFHLIGLKWQNWTVGDAMGLFKQLEWSQSFAAPDEYARSVLLGENYTKQQVEKFLPNTKETWAFGSTVAVEDSLIPEELTSEFLNKNRSNEPAFHPSIIKRYQQLGLFDQFKTVEGSNEFAISGNHTASGQPILAHDPHLQNVMPSQWYQIKAIYDHNGSTHSISGISCSGVPFIVGKTDYLATAMTTIYTDNQDLYHEKVEGDKYFVNGKWHDLKVREERIKVKTGDGIIEEVYPVHETHRGPIIHFILCSIGSYAFKENLSLTWSGFNDEYKPIVSTSHLAEFKTLTDLQRYILEDTEYLFNVNVVFITRDNHIGYQQMGRYPLRANPESSLYIKDGTTTEHDWLGFVPHSHRLQVIDPPSGYIVSANNRIASNQYYNGLHNYTIFTARSDRLHQILSEGIAKGRKFTVQDAKEIVADTLDVYCLQMQSYLKAGIPEAGSALTGFDCNFVATSPQAAMYEVFIYQLHQLIKPHKTDKMSVLSMHSNAQFLFNYIKQAVRDEQKVAVLRQAWGKMKQTLSESFKTSNSSEWLWGQFHKDVMHHLPFSNSSLGFLYDRSFDGSGNLHTVNVGKMNKVEFANFQTSHRANYRAIYSFAEESYWVIDSGSSEKFFSKHYDDQWELFRQNLYLPLIDPIPSRTSASPEL